MTQTVEVKRADGLVVVLERPTPQVIEVAAVGPQGPRPEAGQLPLTGLTLLDAVVGAADTVLAAIGKLQGQISGSVANAIGAVSGALAAHKDDTGNPHGTTKAQLGLGNVDNTADADKPVSTAQAAAIGAKLSKAANLADLADVAAARDNLGAVARTSATGSALLPVGTTAQRDAAPAKGMLRYNETLDQPEVYRSGGWDMVGGGATGGGSDRVFVLNQQTITEDFTVPAGMNSSTTGRIKIANGKRVTLSNGSRWKIL